MTEPIPSTPDINEEREDALRYAARLRGLSLIRMADGSYALARYERTGATLHEIEAYMGTDGSAEAKAREETERQERVKEADRIRIAHQEALKAIAQDRVRRERERWTTTARK
jgi:hypothetical protein